MGWRGRARSGRSGWARRPAGRPGPQRQAKLVAAGAQVLPDLRVVGSRGAGGSATSGDHPAAVDPQVDPIDGAVLQEEAHRIGHVLHGRQAARRRAGDDWSRLLSFQYGLLPMPGWMALTRIGASSVASVRVRATTAVDGRDGGRARVRPILGQAAEQTMADVVHAVQQSVDDLGVAHQLEVTSSRARSMLVVADLLSSRLMAITGYSTGPADSAGPMVSGW